MKIRRPLVAVAAAILGVVGLSVPAFGAGSGRAQRFLALESGANGPQVVVATGVIHAAGRDVQINGHTDHFVFPAGTLVIQHHATYDHSSSDPTTCLFQQIENGTFSVTGGTGAYAHVAGRGTYALKITVVGCSQKKPPTVFELQIDATGRLTT